MNRESGQKRDRRESHFFGGCGWVVAGAVDGAGWFLGSTPNSSAASARAPFPCVSTLLTILLQRGGGRSRCGGGCRRRHLGAPLGGLLGFAPGVVQLGQVRRHLG